MSRLYTVELAAARQMNHDSWPRVQIKLLARTQPGQARSEVVSVLPQCQGCIQCADMAGRGNPDYKAFFSGAPKVAFTSAARASPGSQLSSRIAC